MFLYIYCYFSDVKNKLNQILQNGLFRIGTSVSQIRAHCQIIKKRRPGPIRTFGQKTKR